MGLVGRTLAAHGSDAQKEQILPDLIAGKRIACLAAMTDGATMARFRAGVGATAEAGGQKLDAELASVTAAAVANIFLVPTVSYDAEGEAAPGGGVFLIDRDIDGFSVGDEEQKLGLNGSGTANVAFAGVQVGDEQPSQTAQIPLVSLHRADCRRPHVDEKGKLRARLDEQTLASPPILVKRGARSGKAEHRSRRTYVFQETYPLHENGVYLRP